MEVIKKHLPTQSVRDWFDPIVPIKLVKSALTIQVPSQFFYERIEEQYLSTLRKAIHQVLGKTGKLEYSILIDKGDKQHPPAHLQVPQASHAQHRTPTPPVTTTTTPSSRTFEDTLKGMMGCLHAHYIFENFICGKANLMVKQAGMSIAEKPEQTIFSPLVIYGEVGFGKTHFIQAITQHMMTCHPNLRIIYLSGEQFINQFMLALRHKQMQAFCDLYLHVDALLIDDIQFFKEKTRTQELFFHIFNHLHQGRKQLVFTCDTPPANLQGMHQRLISRFKWGLTLQIQMPDKTTRLEIISKKAAREGIQLPEEVRNYLAEHVNTNIRELEGVLVSLIAHATLAHKTVDLPLAKEVVMRIINKKPIHLSIDHIQQTVSQYFQVSTADLSAKTRRREVVIARQIAMYLSKNHTNHSLSAIGERFGKRDHSTVIHALQTIDNMQQTNVKVQEALGVLTQQLEIHA